ncbi:secreted RxLR effector protein 161-like [Vigna umbellata]|uniref:secreted RxLR effector protein 161-like n=1 Tax=Vigna umbellata TaxID=87088 RepID=UPI001F5E61FE|nr:secreted RxLR effector protein 161-like [Vigna umbellata]
MLDCKEAATPIATNCYLDLDEAANKPDIMHSVCLCARFQSSPKESNLTAVKRILKYLKGTKSLGLWYPNCTNIFLEGYSDSDFEGCKLDKKSTSDTCHLLGSSLVNWHSKKQACVALSTTEAEYIAAGSCCAQLLMIKSQLEDYSILK